MKCGLSEKPAAHSRLRADPWPSTPDIRSKIRASRWVRELSAAGPQRLQDRARRDVDVDQVVETVVEQDLRVEDVDEEGPEEHLEHLFVQEKVHRADRLRVGAREIEIDLIALSPQRAGDLVGAHPHAVVVDEVLEIDLGLGDDDLQDFGHGPLVAVQHFFHRGDEVVDAEAARGFVHAPFGQPQGRDDAVEVGLVPFRHPAVAQDDVQHLLVQFALAIDLDRRDLHPFLEDLGGVGGQRARVPCRPRRSCARTWRPRRRSGLRNRSASSDSQSFRWLIAPRFM